MNLPTPLVSIKWLAANLNHPQLIILDATMDKVGQAKQDFASYPRIEGARFMDLKQDFSDASSDLPNTVPSADVFSRAAQSLGINQDSLIVVYDQHGVYSSPRAWWLFRLMGHEQVAVLDGGLPAWKDGGGIVGETPTTAGETSTTVGDTPTMAEKYSQGNFQADFQAERLASLEQVEQIVKNESHCMIDARSVDRFYGRVPEPRASLRSGHIPKSVSLPYAQVLDGYYMKSPEVLKELFEEINPKKQALVSTCGSGITASILALAGEVAQQPVAVYDGSWSEWGQPSDRPVEV